MVDSLLQRDVIHLKGQQNDVEATQSEG
jgi:hypothetical protein